MHDVRIVRQPHGPSGNSFGSAAAAPDASMGPPSADESSLRRANTVSAPRHQPSASISSTPAASSAFHGAKYQAGAGRFRSGSFGSGPDPGLVRKGSGRAVRTEEVVPESGEEGTTEIGSWGKGLSRQSSLPSRRGFNPVAQSQQDPMPTVQNPNPPPRPPRRISVATNSTSPPPQPSAHMPSHSMSSIAMFSPPAPMSTLDTPQVPLGAGVSRTQSLRAQAKHAESGGLGRSASLKAAGEHYRSLSTVDQAMSPPTEPNTPRNPFTPPSPPPQSSAAAFPPFQLPLNNPGAQPSQGSDLKRHQSLTHGYGSHTRNRLERTTAVLPMELHRNPEQAKGPDNQQPLSPIGGSSLWSPSQVLHGDDGWNRPGTQQIQDAFQALNLGMQGDARSIGNGFVRQPQPQQRQASGQHLADEPSWVAGLVGHVDRMSPQPPRSSTVPNDQYLRGPPGPWPTQPQFLGQAFSYLPNHQQQLLQGGPGQQPVFKGPPHSAGFHQPYPGYAPSPYTPTFPPPTASTPDPSLEIAELAKSKGLNPTVYDCNPAKARFFVIKSYTEDDVQKSLKHGIWSSTHLGNKRLDGAFKESSEEMPIYLFFSVNGSRHFCGVATMMSKVDETKSSSVWQSDKWKGVFDVKWIWAKDIPTTALRHIRLTNTAEQKPITNSRDTQELPYEAGCEVMQIFLTYKSATSLLQDWHFYERAAQPPPAGPMPVSAPPSQPMFGMPPHAFMSGPHAPPIPAIPNRYR